MILAATIGRVVSKIATKSIRRMLRKEMTFFREGRAIKNIIVKSGKKGLTLEQQKAFGEMVEKVSGDPEARKLLSDKKSDLFPQEKLGLEEAARQELQFKIDRLKDPDFWKNKIKGQLLGTLTGGNIFAFQRIKRYMELLSELFEAESITSVIKTGKELTKTKILSELNLLEEQHENMVAEYESIETPEDFEKFLKKYIGDDPEIKGEIKKSFEDDTDDKKQDGQKKEDEGEKTPEGLARELGLLDNSQIAISSWISSISFFPDWRKNFDKLNFEVNENSDEFIEEEAEVIDTLEGTLLFKFKPKETSNKADVYVTENTSSKSGKKTYGEDYVPFFFHRAGRRYLDIYAYSQGSKVFTFINKPRGGNTKQNRQVINGQIYGRTTNKAELQRKTKSLNQSVRGMKGK